MMGTPAAMLPSALFPGLADLLDYPGEGFASAFQAIGARLLPLCSPDASAALSRFLAEVSPLSFEELEEIHTRTFSLAPVCIPYLGVQILGENNFKRGELLAGLARDMERLGIDPRPELPDHLAAVLRLAACLPPEQQEEVLAWLLVPAVSRMDRQADSTATPYRHLIRAISVILNDLQKEVSLHA